MHARDPASDHQDANGWDGLDRPGGRCVRVGEVRRRAAAVPRGACAGPDHLPEVAPRSARRVMRWVEAQVSVRCSSRVYTTMTALKRGIVDRSTNTYQDAVADDLRNPAAYGTKPASRLRTLNILAAKLIGTSDVDQVDAQRRPVLLKFTLSSIFSSTSTNSSCRKMRLPIR